MVLAGGRLPTLNEWLADRLLACGMSQNGLARAISVDASQVNRWVKGTEELPRKHLGELARQIGCLNDDSYLHALKDCEEREAELMAYARKFASSYGFSGSDVWQRLQQRVQTLVDQEHPANNRARAVVTGRYLNDAIYALRACSQPHLAVVTPDSVRRHVQYPVNHFVGLLLAYSVADDLPGRFPEDPFRGPALARLRAMVKARATRSPLVKLTRQHAIHLLARYGEPRDRAMVAEMLLTEVKSADPLDASLGFTGLMLSGKDSRIVEEFLRRLLTERDLATANLQFDAVHYGDDPVEPGSFYTPGSGNFTNTIRQIIRRIEDAANYRGILGLELVKLDRLVERIGLGPFLSAGTGANVGCVIDLVFDDLPDEALRSWRKFVGRVRDAGACSMPPRGQASPHGETHDER